MHAVMHPRDHAGVHAPRQFFSPASVREGREGRDLAFMLTPAYSRDGDQRFQTMVITDSSDRDQAKANTTDGV
jgi:hypothetical protein